MAYREAMRQRRHAGIVRREGQHATNCQGTTARSRGGTGCRLRTATAPGHLGSTIRSSRSGRDIKGRIGPSLRRRPGAQVVRSVGVAVGRRAGVSMSGSHSPKRPAWPVPVALRGMTGGERDGRWDTTGELPAGCMTDRPQFRPLPREVIQTPVFRVEEAARLTFIGANEDWRAVSSGRAKTDGVTPLKRNGWPRIAQDAAWCEVRGGAIGGKPAHRDARAQA
jgi:hypothetical protein